MVQYMQCWARYIHLAQLTEIPTVSSLGFKRSLMISLRMTVLLKIWMRIGCRISGLYLKNRDCSSRKFRSKVSDSWWFIDIATLSGSMVRNALQHLYTVHIVFERRTNVSANSQSSSNIISIRFNVVTTSPQATTRTNMHGHSTRNTPIEYGNPSSHQRQE